MILDIIFLIITISCVIFCFILNKRIIQIQSFKEELYGAFAKFDNSINRAEKLLNQISKFSDDGEKIIKKFTEKADKIHDKLENSIIKADHLVDDLATSISSGNNLLKKTTEIQAELENYLSEISAIKKELIDREFLSKVNDLYINEQIDENIASDDSDEDLMIDGNILKTKYKKETLKDSLMQTFKKTLSQKDYYNLLQKRRLS